MTGPTRRYMGSMVFAMLVVMQPLGDRLEAAGGTDAAQTPLALVQTSLASVQAIVGSETRRGPARERIEIRRVAETLFDFEAMSRRMLGQHWSDGSPQQRAEFVRLLTNFLERTYIGAIIEGAAANTTFDDESIDGVHAQVRSRVAADRGADASIEYRLLKTGERWAVYDVVHDGASLIANYRSQFNSILRTSSFAQLLERMRRNEAHARVAADDRDDRGRRLLLFSVVGPRGTR